MSYTDIRKLPWIERLPSKIRPFFYITRIDRPIGIWLLLLPSLWSIFLANDVTLETVKLAGLFSIGAILMRSAGCIINDIWDVDLDSKVERTKSRPLANADITLRQALILLGVLLVISLMILLSMNSLTIILGSISVLFVIAYPLMKRFTWWPQAFLGLTFNFGVLMGWSAVTGSIELPAILLYVGGIFWTLGYDTIYAHMDTKDDSLIGIKSTARLFGKHSLTWITSFYFVSAALLASAVYVEQDSLLCLPAFIILLLQIKNFNPDNNDSCLSNFKQNKIFGMLLLIGILLGSHF